MQRDSLEEQRETPEYSMHRRESERQAVIHITKRTLELETFLYPAQISNRLLCSGLPPGAFSGGAGEVEDRGS